MSVLLLLAPFFLLLPFIFPPTTTPSTLFLFMTQKVAAAPVLKVHKVTMKLSVTEERSRLPAVSYIIRSVKRMESRKKFAFLSHTVTHTKVFFVIVQIKREV